MEYELRMPVKGRDAMDIIGKAWEEISKIKPGKLEGGNRIVWVMTGIHLEDELATSQTYNGDPVLTGAVYFQTRIRPK